MKTLNVYLKILSVIYFFGFVLHLMDLFGLRLSFLEMSFLWKLWIIYLLILDFAVAILLWRKKVLGEVLLIVLAVSQICVYSLFPTIFGRQDFLIIFHFLTLSLYIVLKWNEVRPKTAEVVESYDIIYTNPIKLKAGDSVKIEKREANPDWFGWVYCVDSRGVAGWVSEKYLDESVNLVIVTKDYDATELSVTVGEVVKIHYEEFGWCWCRNSSDNKGWVPKKNLKIT